MYASPATHGIPFSADGSGKGQPDAPSSCDDALAEKGKRRSHRKSRFGCNNCKLRRVKCDEGKPECKNCRHRRIRCNFATATTPDSGSSHPLSSAEPTASPINEASLVPTDLGLPEIELIYHWTAATAKTLSLQDPGAKFWQTNVTETALTHYYLLHLIFAITALHLAYCRPSRHEEYTAKANQHYDKALPAVTSELSRLNHDNCDAVLLSVQLISFVGWARGPQPGEFLAFSSANERSEWLIFFRGIRSTLETLDYNSFKKSLLPQMSARGKILPPNTRPTFERPLANLRDYIQFASPHDRLASNLVALELLLECYHNRYDGVDSEYHLVFSWLFRMEEDFLEAMQKHEAVPLVLFAHFAVLMNDMEGLWYMKGWTTHVLHGIWGILGEEHKVHIRWPIEAVGWIPP
ncbi:hypothetical protein DM02DRAFT_671889 [Periconia macrospinosa]|uniref:Zn(2)-C6 fungal-type domain-containing protein n=1 Tax=Periconia macrospinosa TaxID=97972 RepID=A0A2V1DRS0_9PLEO|nr:hypothetical protein DM02DRAFT_671889 [Periconia macrospinosa]